MTENNIDIEEIDKLQNLIDAENDSLEYHVSDYFNPAYDKMINHIQSKSKYLTRYAYTLQEATSDSIANGLLDGIIYEIKEISLELRNGLKGSLASSDSLDPRVQLTFFAKNHSLILTDLINRLERIQQILKTSYLEITSEGV